MSQRLGQARHDGGAAALEVDDAAVDLAVGVERRAGGVDAGVEVLRAAFGAVHQRLGRAPAASQHGGQRQRDDKRRAGCRARRVRIRSFVMGRLLWTDAGECSCVSRSGRQYGRFGEAVRRDGRPPGGRRAARSTGRSARQRSIACGQRVENTQPAGRVERRRQLALQHDALGPGDAGHAGRRRQQRLGVRVQRPREDALLGALLHRQAQVHHQHVVGDVAHHAEVVRDEQVGQPELVPAGRPAGSAPAPGPRRPAPTPVRRPPPAPGSSISARAIAMRWRWPPENMCG